VRRRHGGVSIAIGPEDCVAGAEHHVVRAGAAHERLMKIVAHGEFIGEALENRGVSRLNVVEGHGIAAAIVVDGRRIIEDRIQLIRIGVDHQRIEVA